MIDANAYQEIKKFAAGLTECIESTQKGSGKDMTNQAIFNYVLSIIHIHLQLKELDLEKFAYDMEKYYEKKVKVHKKKIRDMVEGSVGAALDMLGVQRITDSLEKFRLTGAIYTICDVAEEQLSKNKKKGVRK